MDVRFSNPDRVVERRAASVQEATAMQARKALEEELLRETSSAHGIRAFYHAEGARATDPPSDPPPASPLGRSQEQPGEADGAAVTISHGSRPTGSHAGANSVF